MAGTQRDQKDRRKPEERWGFEQGSLFGFLDLVGLIWVRALAIASRIRDLRTR